MAVPELGLRVRSDNGDTPSQWGRHIRVRLVTVFRIPNLGSQSRPTRGPGYAARLPNSVSTFVSRVRVPQLGFEFKVAIPRAEFGLRIRVPVLVIDLGFATWVPKLISDVRVPMSEARVPGSKFGTRLLNPTSDPIVETKTRTRNPVRELGIRIGSPHPGTQHRSTDIRTRYQRTECGTRTRTNESGPGSRNAHRTHIWGLEFEVEFGARIRCPNWEPGFGVRIREPNWEPGF